MNLKALNLENEGHKMHLIESIYFDEGRKKKNPLLKENKGFQLTRSDFFFLEYQKTEYEHALCALCEILRLKIVLFAILP